MSCITVLGLGPEHYSLTLPLFIETPVPSQESERPSVLGGIKVSGHLC